MCIGTKKCFSSYLMISKALSPVWLIRLRVSRCRLDRKSIQIASTSILENRLRGFNLILTCKPKEFTIRNVTSPVKRNDDKSCAWVIKLTAKIVGSSSFTYLTTFNETSSFAVTTRMWNSWLKMMGRNLATEPTSTALSTYTHVTERNENNTNFDSDTSYTKITSPSPYNRSRPYDLLHNGSKSAIWDFCD